MKEKMFFISIALLAFLLNPASGAVIRINDSSAQPLGTNVTSITLNEMNNFGSANIELYYNSSVVRVTSASLGFSGYGGSLTPNINNTIGKATFLITALNGPNSPLTLVNVSLQAVGSAGQTSSLGLVVPTLANASGTSVSSTVQNGTFLVLSGTVPNLTGVNVTPQAQTIQTGQTLQFTATAVYSNGNTVDVTSDAAWNSSNPAVGTISTTGLFTAISAGVANITATYQGYTGTATVAVATQVVPKIRINNASAPVNGTNTTQITLTNMSNFGTATIDLYYNPGVVRVTSASIGFSGGTLTPNINNTIGKTRFVITAPSGANSPLTLVNVGLQAIGSANQTSSLGLVVPTLADAAGTQVSSTVQNGTFLVLTGPAINLTGVGVTPQTQTIQPGQTLQFTAIAMYSNGNTVDVTSDAIWSSSNTSVGTISAGLFTAISVGVTNITASYQGYTGTATATVATQVVPKIRINNASAPVNGTNTTQITLTNVSDFGTATIDLYYNSSVVNVASASIGFSGYGGSLTPNINNAIGKARFIITTTAIPGPNSPLTLVNVNLQAVGSAAQTSALGLVVPTLAKTDGTSVTPTVQNGTFEVMSVIAGDVTGNGAVDSIDAMFVAQYVAGTRATLPQQQAGDVASPPCGTIDSIDAMFIAQYVAGTRQSLQLCS
jgi:hypothetical protein